VSTELAAQPGADLANVDEAALAANAIGQIEDADLVLPVITVTQQMSRAVTDGDVESGHFYNAVSGEDYGDELQFIIVAYAKGRFYVHNRDEEDERTYVASGPVAPDTWPEEYAGKLFADIPDAEEQWKVRSNAGEIEWGRGPTIVTTHNYVGFVKGETGIPARIGLSRTSAPAAKKINTILRFGGSAPWASAVKLTLDRREVRQKPFFVVKATQGEQSAPEEIEAAKILAVQIQQAGTFALDGGEATEEKVADAKPSTPSGGVEV